MLKELKKLLVSIFIMSNIFSCVVFAYDNTTDSKTQNNLQIMCILDADDEIKY